MGKRLSDEQIARYERDRFVFPVEAYGESRLSSGRRFGCALLALCFLDLLAGCASGDSSSDQERRGGFYGGVSGGLTR
jgi:hypothetical protein